MNLRFVVLLLLPVLLVLVISPLFGASGFFIPGSEAQWNIVWSLRVPRVILGMIVGSGLAMSGTILQSFFRNDLASPYTLGVASTASLGAVLALFFQLPGIWTELFAILFSLAALSVMLVFYSSGRVRSLATLLLIGLAFGLISSSGIYFLQYLGGIERSFEIYRWLAGGLEVADYASVGIPGAVLLFCMYFIFRNTASLDLMQTSSEFARGRGVDVQRITFLVIWTTALVSGTFVAVCGPIGFIGLIIPHVARRLTGAVHGVLLPVSMVLGGSFLVVMDTLSRVAFAPVEIPVGIITSLVGGPCFLWLLLRKGE
jgi:iron complex transport system permease protein